MRALVALLLVGVVSVVGCGGDDDDGSGGTDGPPSDPYTTPSSDPSTTPPVPEVPLVEQAAASITGFFDDIADIADATPGLPCPTPVVSAQVDVAPIALDEEIGPCQQLGVSGSSWILRVQNRATTPMRIDDGSSAFPVVVEPGQGHDLALTPAPQSPWTYTFSFTIDAASVVALAVDHFVDQPLALDVSDCWGDLSPSCALGLLGNLELPTVRVGRFNLDLGQFADAISFAFDAAGWVDDLQSLQARAGTLTIMV